MSNLCIIPARGGSKRIPRKNIKDFLGKPIIAYSIEIAQESGLFDEIMVSTDDEEIAEISRKYGAQVPSMRSEKNSDDFSVLADVVDEVLGYYSGLKVEFNHVCCILPTAPLIQIIELKRAFSTLISYDFDRVHPVAKFSYPIQRAVRITREFKVSFLYPDHAYSRSQDLEPAYFDAGQFYWFKSNIGLRSSNRGAIVISEKFVQDIDTIEDWELAELKYKLLKS